MVGFVGNLATWGLSGNALQCLSSLVAQEAGVRIVGLLGGWAHGSIVTRIKHA